MRFQFPMYTLQNEIRFHEIYISAGRRFFSLVLYCIVCIHHISRKSSRIRFLNMKIIYTCIYIYIYTIIVHSTWAYSPLVQNFILPAQNQTMGYLFVFCFCFFTIFITSRIVNSHEKKTPRKQVACRDKHETNNNNNSKTRNKNCFAPKRTRVVCICYDIRVREISNSCTRYRIYDTCACTVYCAQTRREKLL